LRRRFSRLTAIERAGKRASELLKTMAGDAPREQDEANGDARFVAAPKREPDAFSLLHQCYERQIRAY
jgi:hypothetical protein